MGLNGSGINEENHIVNGSWIAWLIDDSIGAILSVPFCPYHFVPYHFVLEPFINDEIVLVVIGWWLAPLSYITAIFHCQVTV